MRHTAVVGALLTAAAISFFPVPAHGSPGLLSAGSWGLQGWTSLSSDVANQGVAVVQDAAGRARVVTRGSGSIPPDLYRQGWLHVGDPDSYGGYLLDAYQGRPDAAAKLFVLTAPDGTRSEYVHRLVPGEMFNNSFAAIAPGGHWFISGEWGTINRLLVFAIPESGAHAPRTGHQLPLAAVITLTHPMRRVQGCAFVSPTALVCSTDDHHTDLYGAMQQLINIRLARPLDGRAAAGMPSLLGGVPNLSGCPGFGETEGIDIHGGRLLLAVVQPWPCRDSTLLYSYALAGGAATHSDAPDDIPTPLPGPRAGPSQDGTLNRRVGESGAF